MPLVRNPRTGEIRVVDGAVEPLLAQGWTVPTPEEIEGKKRELTYGTTGQQALAQGERVVRGATLGLVEGFGAPEEVRARAEVSEKLSPVISTAADLAPDIAAGLATGGLGALATGAGRAAGRAAIAEGAGLVRAGLAAGRAGGLAAVAGEALGSGAVGASQQAYGEGRQFLDPATIGQDMENMAIWGGLGFALGAVPHIRGALRARAAKPAKEAAEEVEKELAETAAEARGRAEAGAMPAAAGPDSAGVPLTSDPGTLEAAAGAAQRSPVDLSGMTLEDLGALPLDEATDRASTLAGLRASDEFAQTGRAPRAFDREGHERGITISIDPEDGSPHLIDGRHRFSVAKEQDLPSIWGTVREAGSGKVLYQGDIPLKAGAPAPPPKSLDELASEEIATTAEGGIDRAVASASKADADDVVEAAISAAPAVEREASGLGRQRRLYQNRREIRKAMVREVQSDLTGLVRDVRAISDTRAMKPKDVARNISSNIDAQRIAARSIADDAARFVGDLQGEATAFAAAAGKSGMRFQLPTAQKLTLSLMDHAKQVASARTGQEMFERLDEFKRVVDGYKVSLEQGATQSADPLAHRQLIPRVEAFANRIRGKLEEQPTWGRAAEMQAAYNAVWHDKFIPQFRLFEEAVLKRTHRGYDAMWQTEGWESKIESLLAKAETGERRHVLAMLDAMAETAEVRAKYGAADAKTIKAVTERVDKVKRTISLADELDEAEQKIGALGQAVGGGGILGAIGGGIAGGPIGAAVGAMGGGVTREFVTGDLQHAFRVLTGATEQAVSRGVDDWIRSSRIRGGSKLPKLQRLPKMSEERRQLLDVAKRRGVTLAMASFMGDDDSPNSAFERRRKELMDDDGFFQRMGEDWDDLRQMAPEAFMILAAQTQADRQFLLDRMPANVAVSMMRPMGYPPSRESIEDWAVYWNTLERPTDVIQNLPSIRAQEVETLRERRPRVFEQLQARVLERIGEANASAEPLDDTLLMRLDLLFGFDGAGSLAFSRTAADLAREGAAAEASPGNARGSAPTGAPDRLASPSPAQSGATFGTAG